MRITVCNFCLMLTKNVRVHIDKRPTNPKGYKKDVAKFGTTQTFRIGWVTFVRSTCNEEQMKAYEEFMENLEKN